MPPGPTNWWLIGKALMEAVPGLRPWDMWDFTLAEVEFTLASAENRSPDGRPSMSDDEILAYAKWWDGLTPAERLVHGQRE